MKTPALIPILAIALLLFSCGKEEALESEESAESEQIDPKSLTFAIYQTLKSSGFTDVRATSKVQHPFFPVEGTKLDVIGREMQVFEFESKEDADKAAASISPDGMTINGMPAGWKASPHFYRSDKVISVYVGDDREMNDAIGRSLGKQFAGKK